jgi:cation transport regulator
MAPYRSIAQLPGAVRSHLPSAAQTIYKEAYNNAWDQYARRKDREAVSHKVAWSAVKKKYKKQGEKWVKRKRSA